MVWVVAGSARGILTHRFHNLSIVHRAEAAAAEAEGAPKKKIVRRKKKKASDEL